MRPWRAVVIRRDYFLRRERITSSPPVNRARAAAPEAGSISGTAATPAKQLTEAPTINSASPSTFFMFVPSIRTVFCYSGRINPATIAQCPCRCDRKGPDFSLEALMYWLRTEGGAFWSVFTLALRIAFAMQRAAPSPSAHGAVM